MEKVGEGKMSDIEQLRREYERARDAALMAFMYKGLFGTVSEHDVHWKIQAWQAASDRLRAAEEAKDGS